MAEHKYISLKDVLHNQPNPNVDSEDETDFHFDANSEINEKSSSSNPTPFVLGSSSSEEICHEGPTGEENEKGKKTKKKKKKEVLGKCTRFSSLKHSRSDDPLVYVELGEDGDGPFASNDDLQILCQEFTNFSWEERAFKSKFLYKSEDEEEKEEDEVDE